MRGIDGPIEALFECRNHCREIAVIWESIEPADRDIDGVDRASAEDFNNTVSELFEF